jgi:transcriptional regulator with XRE-family HTH domain
MKTNTNTKRKAFRQNNLRQARHRAGFETKQVSFLLSKNSTSELLHYEVGAHQPNLETALKLEIIYKMPVRMLFQNLFEKLEREIEKTKAKNASSLPKTDWFPKSAEQLAQEEYCFYAELLKSRILNDLEIRTITKHIINLNNTVSDFRHNRNSFAEGKLTGTNL